MAVRWPVRWGLSVFTILAVSRAGVLQDDAFAHRQGTARALHDAMEHPNSHVDKSGSAAAATSGPAACTLRNYCWHETFEPDLFLRCEHKENVFETHEDGTTTATEQLVYGVDPGDTAVMMFGVTLVMLQTPAMGIAQAGMIRRKNSLSMLMQCMSGMAVGSLLWYHLNYYF